MIERAHLIHFLKLMLDDLYHKENDHTAYNGRPKFYCSSVDPTRFSAKTGAIVRSQNDPGYEAVKDDYENVIYIQLPHIDAKATVELMYINKKDGVRPGYDSRVRVAEVEILLPGKLKSQDINAKDENGRTLLHYAIKQRNLSALNYLISIDVDHELSFDVLSNEGLSALDEQDYENPIPGFDAIVRSIIANSVKAGIKESRVKIKPRL